MANIILQVDPELLTWEEFDALEAAGDKQFSSRRFRDIVAKFMVDEQGVRLPFDAARRALGALTYKEMLAAVLQLSEAIKATGGDQLPPASGGE